MDTARSSALELLDQLRSEAHLWFAHPADLVDRGQLATFVSLLSTEEQARYQRFKFEKDRHQFLISHALVRKVLSAYVDVHPSDWQFTTNPYGRPEISAPDIGVPLRFNLTHTEGLAACLVTLNVDCGVDVEKLRSLDNAHGIAGKMFSATEQHALKTLHGHAFTERFFSYWTLREAYCKAIGLGFSTPMDEFSFESVDDEQFKIRLSTQTRGNAERWQCSLLKPSTEHLAAVAVYCAESGERMPVRQFVFPWNTSC